jgi:membrane protease YdiL (CAAX protease family)
MVYATSNLSHSAAARPVGGLGGSEASDAAETAVQNPQYSLGRILGIWALAAVPMAVLSWIVFPLVSPDFGADPLGAGVTRMLLLAAGLIWLFVLSMIIVRREEGDLRWASVKRRLRLEAPRDPKTGEKRRRLWLWAIPLLLAVVAYEMLLRRYVGNLWVSLFPFLAEPAGWGMAAIFQSPEILAVLQGAWWFLALFVVQAAFNTFLGEEFLFRGILLPKMEGVFGKWSWAANGVLHGFYHLHQPWGIAASVVSGLLYAFPSWRFRTTWMGVIGHSAQSVYFAFLILGVVLGLA